MLDKPKTLGEVVESAGYPETVASHPKKIIEQKGTQQALRDLGLTEELITHALVDDIKAKPEKRLGELRLGAEILGMTKPDIQPEKSNNTYNFFFNPEIREKVQAYENQLKEILANVQPIETTQKIMEIEQ